MKYKVLMVTLLVMGLTLGFGLAANALTTLSRTADVSGQTLVPGGTAVIGAVTVNTGADADVITAVKVVNTVVGATGGTDAEVDSLKVYKDVNGNNTLDSRDIWLGAKGSIVGYTQGTGPVSITTNIALNDNSSAKLIIVAQFKKTGVTDNHMFGAVVTATGSAAIAAPGDAQTPRALTVNASHLKFANFKSVVVGLNGGQNALNTGATISAVDDFGNVDVNYNGAGNLTFAAKKYIDPASAATTTITAAGAGGFGAAATPTNGVWSATAVTDLKYAYAGGGSEDVTVVATYTGASQITGSTTVRISGAPFVIAAGNKVLDVTHSVNGNSQVTFAEGTYGPTELCAEIKAKMEADAVLNPIANPVTFAVTYSEVTGKFTIVPSAGTLAYIHATSTVGATLGFTGDIATAANITSQGSRTIYDTAVAGVVNTRGVEIYDVDHNGQIDHATMFFNAPINLNSITNGAFQVAGYTLTGTPQTNFDAGGTGILNAGEYGVTLTLVEKIVPDTNAKPDVIYNAPANGLKDMLANLAPSVGTASAVEVDKARPVLLSAVTKDAGIGTGTPQNGILDGIEFTFSEPVRNVTAGPALVEANPGYVGLAIPVNFGITFSQGNGSINGNVYTIPVGETTINTGVVPTVKYNENYAAAQITDYATSAIGANSYNVFYASNASYAAGDADVVTTDGAPMVVHSVETLDLAAPWGKLDHMRVTFSENATAASFAGVTFTSSIAAFSSLDRANGIYTPTAVVGTGTPQLLFTIDSVAGTVYDTEATPSFQFDPTAQNAGITDGVGNSLGTYGSGGLTHAATRDMAAPAVVAIITGDAYADTTYVGNSAFEGAVANGRLDNVKLIFSEKVKAANGAQNGGTALDNAIAQFAVTEFADQARTKIETTAAVAKPTWVDVDSNGDTKTELTITFQELARTFEHMTNGGDTGAKAGDLTVTYTPNVGSSTYNITDCSTYLNALLTTMPASTDGAAPFLVYGVMGENYSHKSVLTYDKNAALTNWNNTIVRAANNDQKGDGFLEGFVLKFTEPVLVKKADGATDAGVDADTGALLRQFATTAQNGGVLTFNDATARVSGTNTASITITGKRSTQGTYDTGTTPALTYTKDDAVLKVKDTDGNLLASIKDLPSFDNAAPVLVGVNGDGSATTNKLNFTFSEPVYAHDADGKNITFNAANVLSSTLFGYSNLGAGVGASGFTAALVTQPAVNVLQATLNANLSVVDIESDLVWVKTATIFDDANVTEDGLDNISASSSEGNGIKVWIMDDVIAPWITGIKTIDWNGNGKIDHLRVQFSENMQDAIVKGFVSDNAMSNDVSATWKISGYSGPARWNFFDATANSAGYAASIAAGKPLFDDNMKNDNVMYLELDEELVPANVATSIGSTGFKPTVTWGTGADAETMGDFRPNMLDTASTVTTNTPAPATNGTVTDNVGPAIVGVTASGTKLTVLFSEPVATTGTAVKTTDFWFSTIGNNTNDNGSIYGATWKDTSTLELTLRPDFTFAAGTAYGIQILAGGNNAWKDAAGVVASMYTDNLTTKYHGALYAAQSPIATTPYSPKANALGLKAISNLATLANNSTAPASGSTIVAGSTVTLKWTSSNIENVAVYQSFNSGATYEMVPGSQVAASAGSTTWTAKMGVTNVKVQAVGGSAAIGFAYNVVYDGNTIGSSIGAPSALSVYDVPNDNGGFAYAQFTKSADHLTSVNSYQFYREVTVVDSTKAWVLWATVAAGTPDADGKLTVIIPTIWNDNSSWKVAASTGKLISDGVVAAKVAADAIPVAEVVYNAGAAKVAAVQNVSQFSDVATGASIDNIAPSALSSVTAADNDGAGTGVVVSWVAPADHGVVASYTLNNVTNYIYGVDSYEVYRKAAGTQEFVLAGTAGSGSTSFTDAVADGATIYSYLVKAVDSAHSVETVVPGRVMAGNGTSDFNADGAVSLGDLVLLGNMWGLKNTSSDFVANFDLNHDGQISVGDLVLLGGAWTSTSAKVAKAAGEVPMSNIAFQMVSSVNESNKMYYVSINTKDAASINAVSFSLKYDASKFEFVSDSVTGLGDIPLVKADQAGIIDIASLYQNEKFNGTVTLGFKAKDAKSDMNVEMVNAEVALNGVVSSAKNAETVMLKALPQTYALSQNFPNPFNPTTTIEYSIPTTGNVSLVIYNVAGQKIRTLVNGNQSANYYKVIWDGKNDNGMTVGTGTYFYKLVSGNYSKIVKMTLMK